MNKYIEMTEQQIERNMERAMEDWKNARTPGQTNDAERRLAHWDRQRDRLRRGLPVEAI